MNAPTSLGGQRPALRGWSHAIASVGAIVATIGLGLRTDHDPTRLLAVLVYGASMVLSFAASAAYHLGPWDGRRHTALRAIDHASIFVLIAGTYTPFCVAVVPGWLGQAILVLIWGLAAIGVVLTVATLHLPRWVGVALYVGMGWIGLLTAPVLTELLPAPANLTLVAGGLLYTVGALIYARKQPDPFPAVFGFHELFHLFVIAGNTAFLTVIWLWVVPFRHS